MEGDLKKKFPQDPHAAPGAQQSHLDQLEKSLYRRDRSIPKLRREELAERRSIPVDGEWKHDNDLNAEEVTAVRSSFFTKVFLISLAFFVIAAGFAVFVIFGGQHGVSSKNVDISVIGPISVAAGSPLELQIAVQNKNSSALESASLIVEYPQGTKPAMGDASKDLTYERDELGAMEQGAVVQHAVKALLYGETNSIKHIKLSVQYRFKGSNTVFYADGGYDVTINSSPVSLRVTGLDEVTSGQQVDLAVDVVSNSNTLVKGVLLRASYPFGFSPTSFSPDPAFTDSIWDIGDMQPGDKRTIHIKGKLDAQDGENRVFKFETGIASVSDEKSIGTTFVTVDKPVTVKKPFLGVAVTLDGIDAKEYAAAPESTVHAEIRYSNNTSSDIANAEISVKLMGDLYDKQSISAHGGFYRSSDNTIVWNNTTNSELARVTAGDGGVVSFDFKTLPVTKQTGSLKQPQVSFDVSVSGKRLASSSVQESIAAVDTRTIKISSKLGLVSRIVYSTGPFTNKGALPPRADNPVTYTVIWSITNTSNAVTNAKVIATLPSYVSWLGAVVPSGEKIAFDQNTREISWTPGAILPDAGVTKSPREVAFQLSYLPSVSQVGTVPDIVAPAELSGTDTWSGAALSDKRDALTTRLSTDPNFSAGQDTVVR